MVKLEEKYGFLENVSTYLDADTWSLESLRNPGQICKLGHAG